MGRVIHRRELLGAPVALGGMQSFTTVDFPGRLSAVLFCQGCAWRCAYCHNDPLRPLPGAERARDWQDKWNSALAFLHERRGMLEGVVFSGGEPLIQAGLAEAMGEVRSLGFAVGLHTAGVSTARLRRVLPHCDWVGFDIKALPGDYRRVVGADAGAAAWKSLAAVREAGVEHEVRTTWDQQLMSADDLLDLAEKLAEHGVEHWVVQTCRDAQQRPQAAPAAELQAALRERLPGVAWRQ